MKKNGEATGEEAEEAAEMSGERSWRCPGGVWRCDLLRATR